MMRAAFERVAIMLEQGARPDELWVGVWQSEAAEFMRFNRARLVQTGHVARAVLRLRGVQGGRQATLDLTVPGLTAEAGVLRAWLTQAMDQVRAWLAVSPPDPWLDVCEQPHAHLDDGPCPAWDRAAFVRTVVAAAGAADLVGLGVAGPIARGVCSTLGTRLWFERHRVGLEATIEVPTESGARPGAVKISWSGAALDEAALTAAIERGRAEAVIMARPAHRLSPGTYRAWLAPHALAELLGMLNWGGFSVRAARNGQSPLVRLQRGESVLSPHLTLIEDMALGMAPRFQQDGYVRPPAVPLIERGQWAQWLVAPRSAREWGLVSNGAGAHEAAESLWVAPGTLRADEVLPRLDTGVMIARLWYLNFSDRQACRVTGMTRYACFWVQDGAIQAPIEAMRFDDSLLDLLGPQLEALGADSLAMPATDTYDFRETGGITAPSALLSALRLTL